MDKMIKLAVLIGALLAGGGIFYHYVIFLPEVERRKEEQVALEKDRKERQAEQERQYAETQRELRKQTYDLCLAAARQKYDADWAAACDTDRGRKLLLCLSNVSINDRLGCERAFAVTNPNCTLPIKLADSIGKTYSEDQKKCLAEARLGL